MPSSTAKLMASTRCSQSSKGRNSYNRLLYTALQVGRNARIAAAKAYSYMSIHSLHTSDNMIDDANGTND